MNYVLLIEKIYYAPLVKKIITKIYYDFEDILINYKKKF